MIALTKLLRRTAVTLSAIAALTVTGLATAQTVTLSGISGNPSCTYSQMTPSPSNPANLTFLCGVGSTDPTFTLTAPTQLPQNVATTTQIKINRTVSSTGDVDVDVAVVNTSNCVMTTTSPVHFPSGSLASIPVVVTPGPAANGTCQLAIAARSPGVNGLVNTATINVVDPDGDVTFAFAAADSNTTVGGAQVALVVNRTGGTNGAFTVPVQFSGALSAPLVGSFSKTTLTFLANSTSDSVTYTPPASYSGALPADLVVTLGQPTKTSPASAQGSSSSTTPNTIHLGPKSTSCNAAVNPQGLPFGLADVPTVALPSGGTYTFELPPTSQRKVSGVFKLSSTTSSFPVAPWNYEVMISKCAGQIDAAVGGTCYISSSNSAQLSLTWFESVPLSS
ncbi:MAG TPA: hypothetical protein VLU24_06550, partial [Mycobacterium sp.]|nr:hypothetical protein [Mycobacterium sp.]